MRAASRALAHLCLKRKRTSYKLCWCTVPLYLRSVLAKMRAFTESVRGGAWKVRAARACHQCDKRRSSRLFSYIYIT